MPNDPFENTNKVNAVIQVRRGYDSERTTLEYNEGEIVYATDSRRLYVGGTAGGRKIVGGSVVGNLVHVVPSISHAHYVEKYDMLYNYTSSKLYSLTGTANSSSVNDYCLIFDKSEFVLKSDAKLTGDLDMDFFAIKHLKDAVDDNDATNLGDVKDITSALERRLNEKINGVIAGTTGVYVEKDGDTMTGPLTIEFNGASTTSLKVASGLTELQDTIVGGLTAKGKVEISGDELLVKTDTNIGNKQLTNFSAKIINSDSDLLELDANLHNGCILVCSKEAGTGTEKIQIKISKARLVTGFNCVIIQGGDRQLKIISNDGTTLANADDKFTSRRKYSQINICMIDASTLWVTGDLVQ